MPHPDPDTNCWSERQRRQAPVSGPGAILGLLIALAAVVLPPAGRAGVEFDNCQPTPDGGITCDTRPTGNTLADDEAARFGLFNEASPGWAEFDPYEGDDDMFGGNET
ncbi:MAG: hypothetical protein RLZZ124_355 [Cyanobacteriota bacterium]|jgi:hypothetical protein